MGRPFQVLKIVPRQHYDAIIIGAGIGGLVCANLLARQGLDVLLIEQHYMVGGYCSIFRRKGFTFDAATHFYPLLGNPHTMTGKLLLDLGITTGWVKMDPVDQFHFPDGSQFAVPADFASYVTQLKAAFPAEAQALDAFFALVKRTYMLGLLYYFRGRDTAQLNPYRHLTVQQVLEQHFHDRKLKLLLTADCPHWGSPPSRTSFVFDSMLRLSYFLGNYYPRGGSQTFADELAQRFTEHGGHILMHTLVRRILVEHDRAYGVEVESGRESRRQQIYAENIVSNGDLRQTLEQMVGPAHLDAAYLHTLHGWRPTYPCFLTHIGLDANVPTAVLRQAHGYYWDDWDTELVGRNGLRCKIFVPTLYEPDLARHGGHVVIVQKVLDLDYDAITDWPAHKAAMERYIMEHLERTIPGVSKHIVVKLSASALTSQRYTLNYQGAMLGWEMSPEQLGAQRFDVVGPIDRLYFVGHWVQPGGGITPVIVSAVKVAHLITRESTGALLETPHAAVSLRQQPIPPLPAAG